jgi:hypothetical protein
MTVTLPTGWRREVRPDNTTVFLVGEAGSQDRSEIQFSSFDAPLEQGMAQQGLWNEMLRQLDAPGHQKSGRLGRFGWSEMEAFDRTENRRFWYRLFTTKEGPTHVVILIAANSTQAFRDRIVAMEDALSKARFADAPGAAIRSTDDIPIVESRIHMEIRPISFGSNVTTDHILFFQNGIAVRMGFINGPRECYAALPVTNLQSLPFNYGRWRENPAGRTLDVDWQEGPSWHLVSEGGLLSLEGKKLVKFRPIDGAKFDGVYAYRPVGDEPTVLSFTAAGRFETRNLTDSMLCQTGQPVAKNGSGSYEVHKWTLILRFDDGVTTLLPLRIPDDEQDLRKVRNFTVMSYDFAPVR